MLIKIELQFLLVKVHCCRVNVFVFISCGLNDLVKINFRLKFFKRGMILNFLLLLALLFIWRKKRNLILTCNSFFSPHYMALLFVFNLHSPLYVYMNVGLTTYQGAMKVSLTACHSGKL